MADLLRKEIKQTKPFESPAHEAFLNIQRTSDYLTRRLVEMMKPYSITPAQYNVLRILRGAGEQGLINKDIGERMLTYVPDVTRMLDRLESRGFICRERGVEDRRLVTAFITDDGKCLLGKLDDDLKSFHQELFHECSDDEIEHLINTLEKLRK